MVYVNVCLLLSRRGTFVSFVRQIRPLICFRPIAYANQDCKWVQTMFVSHQSSNKLLNARKTKFGTRWNAYALNNFIASMEVVFSVHQWQNSMVPPVYANMAHTRNLIVPGIFPDYVPHAMNHVEHAQVQLLTSAFPAGIFHTNWQMASVLNKLAISGTIIKITPIHKENVRNVPHTAPNAPRLWFVPNVLMDLESKSIS